MIRPYLVPYPKALQRKIGSKENTYIQRVVGMGSTGIMTVAWVPVWHRDMSKELIPHEEFPVIMLVRLVWDSQLAYV